MRNGKIIGRELAPDARFDITSGDVRGSAGNVVQLTPGSTAAGVSNDNASQEVLRLNQPDDVSRAVTVNIQAVLAPGVAQVANAIRSAQAVFRFGTQNGQQQFTLDVRQGITVSLACSFLSVEVVATSRDTVPTSGIIDVTASMSENNSRGGNWPNHITTVVRDIPDQTLVTIPIPDFAWGVQLLRAPTLTTDLVGRWAILPDPPFAGAVPEVISEWRTAPAGLGMSHSDPAIAVPAPATNIQLLNVSGGGVAIDAATATFFLES